MTKRRFKVHRGGGDGETPKEEESSAEQGAVNALESSLDMSLEGLSESHEFLRLLGAVVGQITLLDVATGTSDPKARASAARALLDLKEKPEQIAERLRSSKFKDLQTSDLKTIVEDIRDGMDPKVALEKAIERKEA